MVKLKSGSKLEKKKQTAYLSTEKQSTPWKRTANKKTNKQTNKRRFCSKYEHSQHPFFHLFPFWSFGPLPRLKLWSVHSFGFNPLETYDFFLGAKKTTPVLVGGWTNPSDKYLVKMGSSSPIFGVKIIKSLKPQPRVWFPTSKTRDRFPIFTIQASWTSSGRLSRCVPSVSSGKNAGERSQRCPFQQVAVAVLMGFPCCLQGTQKLLILGMIILLIWNPYNGCIYIPTIGLMNIPHTPQN